MERSGYSVSEKIVNDVKGSIVELKNVYFPDKTPFNDDQVLVQKLCVQLEKVLRYGAREKYTFLGVRKDYWNYISDCISKDETVKFVQSISEVKTNQGKGRALLRQALMEKTLADTFQRCVINERISKEYYVVDSIFRHDQHFQTLIHLLYDLNAMDFFLPYKGYDLDRSWPAFMRKTFDDGRKNSTVSVSSEQGKNDGDPIVILHTIIEGLSKTICSWKGTTFTPLSINLDTNPLTLQRIIEQLLSINEDLISTKMKSTNEITTLKTQLLSSKEENKKMKLESESQIKRIHDRYLVLQQTDKSSDQLQEAFDKLMVTEIELNNTKNEFDLITKHKSRLELQLQEITNDNESMKQKEITSSELVKHAEDMLQLEKLENKANVLKLEQLKDEIESLTTALDKVDGKSQTRNESDNILTNETTEQPTNDLHLFIEDIVRHLYGLDADNENDEPANSFDSEDGLFKKSKKKKSKKDKNQVQVDIPETKEEQQEVIKKLVELRKEIVFSREEKGDYQKEIIGLQYEVANLNTNISELKEGTEKREVHRHHLQEKQTSTEVESLKDEAEQTLKQREELEQKCEELEDKVKKLTADIDNHNAQIFDLSIQTSKLNQVIVEKDTLIAKLQESCKHGDELQQEHNMLNETLAKVQQELSESKQLIDELKLDFDNINNVRENENKSMKFEVSTLQIKYETSLKELSDLQKKHEDVVNDLSSHEESRKVMESKQNESNIMLIEEKENILKEKSEIKKKHDSISDKFQVAEKEIKFLKIEIAKLAKDKEDDRQTKLNLQNRISNMKEERKSLELKHKDEMKYIEEENQELRDHTIDLTKDKHELWQNKQVLEVELKSKIEERWVKDEEVKTCTNCQELFSLTLRKHHCRLCGHIYCHACSNRWIKTQHSRKRIRACNVCADVYEEKHQETCDVVDGGLTDTMSDRSSFMETDEFDESINDMQSNASSDHLITDAFEILDPANVSTSGSFGPSEEIKVLEKDIIQSPIIPTVQKGDESLDDQIEKENVELTLYAGQRSLVPIVIGGSQFELIWEFTSTPKDIGFGVATKTCEEESDTLIETIIPLSRYISHKQTIHGKMMVTKPGIYYLTFDNSYSRLTTKSVVCSFTLARY